MSERSLVERLREAVLMAQVYDGRCPECGAMSEVRGATEIHRHAEGCFRQRLVSVLNGCDHEIAIQAAALAQWEARWQALEKFVIAQQETTLADLEVHAEMQRLAGSSDPPLDLRALGDADLLMRRAGAPEGE